MRLQAGSGCEYFATVRARVTEVFDALVDDFNVSVKVTLLAEDFIALGAGGWFVYLNIEVDLK